MIPAHIFKDQKIGVFGLGKAGEAAVQSLLAGGATVFADDDKLGKGQPYATWSWSELKALVLAPGVAETHPCALLAKKHQVSIIGDIEILCRSQPDARKIGITGTNGKSTTTTLIGHILKEAGERVEVGGNLGTAALSLAPLGKGETYVLELSSYQLDLVHTTCFNVAVFLNITPDHLDRHGDMAGYIAAKKHIFDRQTKDDVAIIAVDDEYTKALVNGWKLMVDGEGKLIKVSVTQILSDGIYVKDGVLYDNYFQPSTISYQLPTTPALTGQHNWQNAALAYAAARAQGISPEKIIALMRTFPGLRHRLQLVKTIDGVRFINDSKATNADAVSHALKPYNNIYWIAGGKAKAGGIEPLVPLFLHIARAYLIGEAADEFAKTLEDKVPYVKCGTLDNAVKRAAEDAFAEKREGAVVLLSPACASFDQFNSFEHRGDVFCQLVESSQWSVTSSDATDYLPLTTNNSRSEHGS